MLVSALVFVLVLVLVLELEPVLESELAQVQELLSFSP